MYYVYIIESLTSRRCYFGHTNDLDERLKAHNSGWNVSTKGRGPWQYIFQRPMNTLKEAVEFEKYLKTIRNKGYILKKYPQYFLSK